MGAAVALRVDAQLAPGVWTNLTPDTSAIEGLHLRYGIQGNGPLDCVAGTGESECVLRNAADNSAGRQGAYSPLHASALAGWTFGIPYRVVFTSLGIEYIKFTGKIQVIDPDAGQFRSQRVRVTAYDGIRDLAETGVRELAVLFNQTEEDLFTAVLDAIPAESQPIARDLDVGVDTLPLAFFDLGEDEPALALIKDIAVDTFSLVAMRGDGTLFSRSRHTRALGTSAYTFANTMHGLAVPSSLDQAFNRVRVTIHPPTIDDLPTTVLYTETGTPRAIAPGETIEFFATYASDPADPKTLIGGLDIVDPLVAGTDYAGNALVDGSGANLTSDLIVAIDPFGSAAKLTITNTGAATVYLVDGAGLPFLQIRGRGIYTLSQQTYEARSVQPYGTRTLAIGLRYQDDPYVAQSAADFTEAQRHGLANQPTLLIFLANDSPDFLLQALAREVGDRITITEPVTGMTLVDAVIQSVAFDVSPGPWIVCTWGLAPAAPFAMWQLGIAGLSELGETTILGF